MEGNMILLVLGVALALVWVAWFVLYHYQHTRTKVEDPKLNRDFKRGVEYALAELYFNRQNEGATLERLISEANIGLSTDGSYFDHGILDAVMWYESNNSSQLLRLETILYEKLHLGEVSYSEISVAIDTIEGMTAGGYNESDRIKVFAVEYLTLVHDEVSVNRVPIKDWPTWADQFKRDTFREA